MRTTKNAKPYRRLLNRWRLPLKWHRLERRGHRSRPSLVCSTTRKQMRRLGVLAWARLLGLLVLPLLASFSILPAPAQADPVPPDLSFEILQDPGVPPGYSDVYGMCANASDPSNWPNLTPSLTNLDTGQSSTHRLDGGGCWNFSPTNGNYQICLTQTPTSQYQAGTSCQTFVENSVPYTDGYVMTPASARHGRLFTRLAVTQALVGQQATVRISYPLGKGGRRWRKAETVRFRIRQRGVSFPCAFKVSGPFGNSKVHTTCVSSQTIGLGPLMTARQQSIFVNTWINPPFPNYAEYGNPIQAIFSRSCAHLPQACSLAK